MYVQYLMNSCRLRKFRKSAHLTQREVAALVGYSSQRAYSDMELGIKRPALGPALACCTLFGVSLHELFPGFAESIERGVLSEARKLHANLKASANRESAALHIATIISALDGSSQSE